MRFIIDMDEPEPGRIEGCVSREGDQAPLPFSGWIELLSLLEPAAGQADEPGDGPACQPPHGDWLA